MEIIMINDKYMAKVREKQILEKQQHEARLRLKSSNDEQERQQLRKEIKARRKILGDIEYWLERFWVPKY